MAVVVRMVAVLLALLLLFPQVALATNYVLHPGDTASVWTPSPTPAPSPVVVPTTPSCIQITSPADGANVTGVIPIKATDTCVGRWYEELYVDGTIVAAGPMGSITLNTALWSNGPHTIRVDSHSMNPGGTVIDCSRDVKLYFSNAVAIKR